MPIGKFPGEMHGMRHGHIDGIPYFRFWCQKTLPALYDDSLSYYDLLTNVVWYINQLINVAKAYDEKFAELEGLYIELEHYVATYFDKLDVEQTVADILNDMAYSGRLTEIMTTYINDYSIDAKKIKNGFVPVHYEFVKCDDNFDYYKRDLTDREMLDALNHGSILLGFFNGSPQFGNFIMFNDTFEYEYNGKTVECKCGCSCEHMIQNYKVTYREAMANKNGKLVQYIVTDVYCHQYAEGYYGKMYADVEDGSITTEKLADKAVTHEKLADDAVWENNIKDGAVTPRKLGKGNIVILGDIYDISNGGWSSKLVANLGIGNRTKIAHADGAGFSGNNNQTFLKLLQGITGQVNESFRLNTSYILVGGGNDDQGKGEGVIETAMNEFGSYVRTNYPNATVIVAQYGWKSRAITGASTYNYPLVSRRYIAGCGTNGFRFIQNSPYVLHDYSKLDSSGYKPNALGCDDIANMFGIELAGGTYDMIGHRKLMNYTINDELYIGEIAQNHMFPGDFPNPQLPSFSTWEHNDIITLHMGSVHTIEFKNPKNLHGHIPQDKPGYTGAFKLFDLDPNSGYCDMQFYCPHNQQYPCGIVDKDYNCVQGHLGIYYHDNAVWGYLYNPWIGQHKPTTEEPFAMGIASYDNVKYIHTAQGWDSFTMFAYDC